MLLPVSFFLICCANALINACTPTAPGSDEFTLGDRNAPPVKMDGGGAVVNISVAGVLADCTQCQQPLPVRRLVLNSRAITQTANAVRDDQKSAKDDRCTTLTLHCVGNGTESAVILTYYNSTSDDVGSTFGSAQVAATLQCTTGGQWAVANATNIAELECISS